MEQKQPIIRISNLSVSYDDTNILHDVSFDVSRGSVFIIMGQSGCGKSTLMRSIIGLHKPDSGKILINGVDFWGIPEPERLQIMQTFGVSYQSGALFSSMTLLENVMLPMQVNTDWSDSKIHKTAMEKLDMVDLAKYHNFYPSEISGGMNKRGGIARALALNPEILFFDEPSAGVDPILANTLDEMILNIKQKIGTTIVVVTHDLDSIFTIGQDSVFIDNHTTIHTGPLSNLKTKSNSLYKFITRNETRTITNKRK